MHSQLDRVHVLREENKTKDAWKGKGGHHILQVLKYCLGVKEVMFHQTLKILRKFATCKTF